ncbi:Peroxisome assembly protein 22 [Candida viswanathii]|uniref:Peroxisome assembly protein 22 n=1 Tax=Candida viswanathii TaxID=5486 RepID=A0A367XNR8_9ASCO|nr:Peroxisome assembly protein 22 [Candida viswanathii]
MMSRKAARNPNLYLTALVATSAVAITYKIYTSFFQQPPKDGSEEDSKTDSPSSYTVSKRYSNKSIAITLSSSFLSSSLPLNKILTNSERMIFIIPPNLTEDDLNLSYIPPNFKLLKCSNLQGYLQILKNLKPDLLLMCSDDLGLDFTQIKKDLNMFINDIINVDQNDDIILRVRPIFD